MHRCIFIYTSQISNKVCNEEITYFPFLCVINFSLILMQVAQRLLFIKMRLDIAVTGVSAYVLAGAISEMFKLI